ncbi:putative nuclease HARBI1 [Hydra vulgaris]|uniref:Nuclease HARBI1 n=1 Tax=Hydra vulgaris TaxID=6087 RepID=A0ABM4CM63_HYDVU
MTANCFGIAVNTVSSIITQVCEKIVYYLGPIYKSLPKKEIEMRQKVIEFESKFGMIQAFGCIDGTHVPIVCLVENSQDYFCYKQYYSMNVQAVCDYKGMFMDIECVWPGSVHDSKVFSNSSINKKLRDGFLPARNPIECAFGRLKARWAILTRKIDFKLELVPIIVYATFVLHNFCEKHKTLVDSDSVNNQVQLIKFNEETYINQPNPGYSNKTAEGELTRTLLTSYISDCLPN